MKRMGWAKALAVPVLVAASVTFAQAQTARQEAKEAKQETKEAARSSGNAIKDSWITLKVHSQFVPEDALEGSDIDVDTKAGVVTLTGTVASEAGRTRAVSIAKATGGVQSVNDRLTVGAAHHDATAGAREAGREVARDTREAGREAKDAVRDATGTAGRTMSDGWIKSKIAAQYVTEDSLDNSDIDIDITSGAVVLSGAVRTAAARDRATAIAKATDGVKSVKNNLNIDPNVK